MRRFGVVTSVVALAAVMSTGCTSSAFDLNNPQQLATLDTLVRMATANGATIFLETKDVSVTDAQKLIDGCNAIIDLLAGQDVVVTDGLMVNIPVSLQYLILDAIHVFQAYAAANWDGVSPLSLTPGQKQLLVAAIGGVKTGAQRYLATIAVPSEVRGILKKAYAR